MVFLVRLYGYKNVFVLTMVFSWLYFVQLMTSI